MTNWWEYTYGREEGMGIGRWVGGGGGISFPLKNISSIESFIHLFIYFCFVFSELMVEKPITSCDVCLRHSYTPPTIRHSFPGFILHIRKYVCITVDNALSKIECLP